MPILNQIQTIVIVMMENRSFDNVLGHLSMARFGNRKNVEGLIDPETNLDYTNFLDGVGYQPFQLKDERLLHDLPHGRPFVETQLAKVSNRLFTMSGFADAYYQATGSKVNDPPSLGFLAPSDAAMSNFLATQYAVCDNWFAPLPTDTQPNRSVAYSGYSLIDDTKARPIPTMKGSFIFEWLNAHNVSWRVYHCGISFFTLFDKFHEVLGPNFRSFRRLPGDFESEPLSEMPNVIFIEPEYSDSPVHFGWTPNDNHPPTPIGPGEHFLRDIYNLLTKDPAKWSRTLLITTHDEHGGFFDHVPPLVIPTPIPPGALFSDRFKNTGPRVPALIVSPWISPGTVFKGAMDHTSILQLLSEMFAGTPDYNDEVKRRRELGIQSVSQVLAQPLAQPRTVIPAPPDIISRSVELTTTTAPQTDSQQAFAAAARNLLLYDRKRALENFPELANLPEE